MIMAIQTRTKTEFPNGARAAFTIFDDADQGNKQNLEPIYDVLNELEIKITRSTWVFPSRRGENTGHLLDDNYLNWLKKIWKQGFEIALHNVGNGIYTREEILEGLELFKRAFGSYPKIQCNHHSNPENVYWNPSERFSWPVSWLYIFFGKDKRTRYYGTSKGPFFWGDCFHRKIKYVRNLVFNDINTYKMDPYMPYWDPARPLVPFWFSSTDLRDCRYFTKKVNEESLDRLCNEGGCCIGYTHFGTPGFIDARGKPSKEFLRSLSYLKQRDIWIAPVSEVLDHLLNTRNYYDCELTKKKALLLSLRWAFDRIKWQKY